jgi:hypothetical protein
MEWTCPACDSAYTFALCSSCRAVSHVPVSAHGKESWGCVWCGAHNSARRGRGGAANAADLAVDVESRTLSLEPRPVQCPSCNLWLSLKARQERLRCPCGYEGFFVGCQSCPVFIIVPERTGGRSTAWITCGLCGHRNGSKYNRIIPSSTAGQVSANQIDLGLVINDPGCSTLGHNILIGAVHLDLPVRSPILLCVSSECLTLNAWLGAKGWQVSRIPLSSVTNVQVGGPGLIQTGGGFIGGGFGITGALEGMAVASVLNSLTTRSRVETIVSVTAMATSFVLLHTIFSPAEVEIRLLPLTSAVNRNSQSPAVLPATSPATDPAMRLRQLAELRDAGLLTADEYAKARQNAARALINGEAAE